VDDRELLQLAAKAYGIYLPNGCYESKYGLEVLSPRATRFWWHPLNNDGDALRGGDACTHPGACCRGFVLNHPFNEDDWQQQAKDLMEQVDLPFMRPVRRFITSETLWKNGVMFDCDRLGADGRCTDYENRPQLCRDYQAGEDPLCAIHEFKLKGIPIRKAQG
jgi:Fe-S-cluster containining protein